MYLTHLSLLPSVRAIGCCLPFNDLLGLLTFTSTLRAKNNEIVLKLKVASFFKGPLPTQHQTALNCALTSRSFCSEARKSYISKNEPPLYFSTDAYSTVKAFSSRTRTCN
ncbi:hypothetical protein BT96DRAFT_633041 [Gymnopus androsaceus JB14]|uniref:Uncharacterized protein n=1 Tax=Gymnopus androsaceus JB14 TaxID=1447944 RepID=A0A6A4GHK3_9AGAR|nr:hypothetical protein BT96DRAFT_633041 [Gymnopus androsaceus JB14]